MSLLSFDISDVTSEKSPVISSAPCVGLTMTEIKRRYVIDGYVSVVCATALCLSVCLSVRVGVVSFVAYPRLVLEGNLSTRISKIRIQITERQTDGRTNEIAISRPIEPCAILPSDRNRLQ